MLVLGLAACLEEPPISPDWLAYRLPESSTELTASTKRIFFPSYAGGSFWLCGGFILLEAFSLLD